MKKMLRLVYLALVGLFLGFGASRAQTPAFRQAAVLGPSGGGGTVESVSMTTDALGNTYVTGLFRGLIRLGNYNLTSAALTNSLDGTRDMYVAKFSPAGLCLWAVNSRGMHYSYANGGPLRRIAVDNAGRIYIVGNLSGPASFGNTTIGSGYCSYVARLDAAGTWLGATIGGGFALAVAVDSGGNAYVAGQIVDQTSNQFGSVTLAVPYSPSGTTFVAKLNQNGAWSWAVGAEGYYSYPTGIAVDGAGNAFLAGAFQQSLNFGALRLTATTANNGDSDVFVAKVSPTGSWVWAVRGGGAGADAAQAITLESNGNIFLAGYYAGPAASFGSTSLAGAGTNLLVAKLDGAGNWLWVAGSNRVTAASGGATAQSITTDASGNAYLAGGTYGGTATTLGATTLTTAGLFVAKINGSGTWQWAVPGGGRADVFASSIAVSGSGNVYVAGSYQSAATFGTVALLGSGYTSAFLTQLDTAGNYGWSQALKGTGNNITGKATAVDARGNYYITGYFAGTCTLGAFTLTSAGGTDAFVAKLDAAGNYLWVVSGGGSSTDFGADLAVDGSGNVYVVNSCAAGTVTFGALSQPNATPGVVVEKLDSMGTVQWLTRGGATPNPNNYPSEVKVTGLAIDAAANVCITGTFGPGTRSIDLGSTTLVNSSASVVSGDPLIPNDIFVAKLSSSGAWLWARKAGSGGSRGSLGGGNPGGAVNADDNSNDVAMDASGNVYITGSTNAVANNPAAFGNFSVYAATVTTSSLLFVAKLDAQGNWQWAVQSTGGGTASSFATASGIAVDGSGSLYITGTANGTIGYGSTSLTQNSDVFVGKLDNSGRWLWATSSAGPAYKQSNGIALDGSGQIYVVGKHSGGASAFGSSTLSSAGVSKAFVAKLSNSGAWQGAVGAAGPGADVAMAVAAGTADNVFLTGFFTDTAVCGPSVLAGGSIGSGFIAWLGDRLTTSVVQTPRTLANGGFLVWPNPSHNRIQVQGLPPGEVLHVYNAVGQLVATAVVPVAGVPLALPLPPGVYLLRSHRQQSRLVIQ